MKHVIVVEDDPHNALLFRRVLERRGGFRVTVTESAEELFRHCHGGGVALVLLDVSLSHTVWQGRAVNGVDVCRLLKADPLTVGIPVLLATAHAMSGDAERLLAGSGAEDYVSKPVVDHVAFLEQVKSLVAEAA